MIAGVFAFLFVAVVVMAIVRLRWMILYGAEGAGPVPMIMATGIQLAVLSVIIALLWRVSNHFLYPATHGFGVCDRESAVHLLDHYSDLDLSQASLPDPLYSSLRLRELLLIYTLMDRDEHADRLLALLASIKAHPDLANQDREPAGELPILN